jgi:aminoglycoside phosphotransferase (APT) family kinase protein
MASSPLILAALAKAALPSAKFKSAKALPSEGRGPIDSALLTDTDGIQVLVRQSRNAKGNLQLATETAAVRAVKSSGVLPFKVPNLIAEATTPEGKTLQILEFVYGTATQLESVRATDSMLRNLGLAIGAIHSLSAEKIRTSGMPEYSPSDVRESKLAELDRAAATGRVPATLLQRWESALEDLDLFRFQTVPVHGNFTTGNVLELDGEVSGIIGWSELRIGDPAEDFVTFAANEDHEVLDAVKFAYFERREDADSNLAQRATLYSELAFANYLVTSISNNKQDEADWAVEQLEAIAESVDSGSARILSTVAFAAITPIAFEEAEDLVVPDTHTVVTEVDDEVDVSDLKTRPIELPNTSDDQLF